MLYIIRHGQTEWNALHKLQGRTDIPLNDNGRRMAKEAGERYKNIHIDICYSSPLIRAVETAKIFLRDRDIPVITDDRLMEMSFGIYEGVADSFDIPNCPINACFNDPVNYKAVEGGESFDELYARTGSFIKEIVKPLSDDGKDILIVGHGAMNCSIIAQLRGIPLEDFWSNLPGNCELVKLDYMYRD